MSEGLFFAWTAFCALWMVGVIVASVLYRRGRGKPIWPLPPPNADFVESGASGRSLRSLITRIGGARNCLLVYVADQEFVVSPIFPFTLMFLPEIYGLECRAAASTTISDIRSSLFGKIVRIAFTNSDEAPMELRLRDPEGLVAALGPTAASRAE